MKKIFATIIALAALVSCNTEAVDEVVSTPQYLTTSFEVDLNGESRVFNENLEWSWTVDDKIAAYQVAGEQIVNTLSLKANGKFGTDEFKYATNDPADFKFVYPAAALNADKSLGYVQTGEWTPTLVGIVNDATVNNIGTVEMKHMSAAFEIRVWDEGRETQETTIKSATITSKTDGGVSASLTNLSTNTVVFNVAQGEKVVYDITLVDTNDRTYTISNKELNFVNGKRTILNVEWKPTVSFNVISSYTHKDNTLDGRSIYVKDVVLHVADSAAIALYLNGNKAADLTPGKTTTVSNLALGEYKAVVKWTVNGKEYTSGETKVYVTGIPYTLNPAKNDSWNAWSEEGNVTWNNSDRGTAAVRIGHAVGEDFNTGESYIQKTFFVPENTTVVAKASGEVCGSGFTFVGVITTTYTYSVSGTTVGSDSQAGTESGSWYNKKYGEAYKNFSYSKEIIMTKNNPVVKHHNSNSTNKACTYVKSSQILYAE